jgi:hypothetical protein
VDRKSVKNKVPDCSNKYTTKKKYYISTTGKVRWEFSMYQNVETFMNQEKILHLLSPSDADQQRVLVTNPAALLAENNTCPT